MEKSSRPTIVDVARLAGVSIKTVSRVINDEPHVRPETAEKVNVAIAALGFRRNDMAHNLRAGQTHATIGIVTEDLSNPFYSAVLRGAEEVASKRGAMIIAASSEEDPLREREIVTALLKRQIDGLLIVPAGDDHSYLESELATGLPIVFLDRPPNKIKADQVVLDNAGGAQEGVARILAEGHERIAVLGPSHRIATTRQRYQGFVAAMNHAGVAVDDDLVALNCRDPEGAARVAGEMMQRESPPTAFFTLDNRMTVGLLDAIWEMGTTSRIVAFDDFELAKLLPVPMTQITADVYDLGRKGAELLFRRLDGKGGRVAQRIVMPTTLVERGRHGATLHAPAKAAVTVGS